jgi:hypothetical protein
MEPSSRNNHLIDRRAGTQERSSVQMQAIDEIAMDYRDWNADDLGQPANRRK